MKNNLSQNAKSVVHFIKKNCIGFNWQRVCAALGCNLFLTMNSNFITNIFFFRKKDCHKTNIFHCLYNFFSLLLLLNISVGFFIYEKSIHKSRYLQKLTSKNPYTVLRKAVRIRRFTWVSHQVKSNTRGCLLINVLCSVCVETFIFSSYCFNLCSPTEVQWMFIKIFSNLIVV